MRCLTRAVKYYNVSSIIKHTVIVCFHGVYLKDNTLFLFIIDFLFCLNYNYIYLL